MKKKNLSHLWGAHSQNQVFYWWEILFAKFQCEPTNIVSRNSFVMNRWQTATERKLIPLFQGYTINMECIHVISMRRLKGVWILRSYQEIYANICIYDWWSLIQYVLSDVKPVVYEFYFACLVSTYKLEFVSLALWMKSMSQVRFHLLFSQFESVDHNILLIFVVSVINNILKKSDDYLCDL